MFEGCVSVCSVLFSLLLLTACVGALSLVLSPVCKIMIAEMLNILK